MAKRVRLCTSAADAPQFRAASARLSINHRPNTVARRGEPVMTKRDRKAWILAGALFLALFFIWGVAYDCFPILLPSVLKQFHLTKEQIGKVPAAQALAALVVGPLVGWLLDRVAAQIVMSIGALLTAVGIVMMARAGSFNGVIAGSVVTGVG